MCHCSFFAELLVDDMSLAGCSPSILRANAEDFIHVFVAQPIRLITFLTHMVEVMFCMKGLLPFVSLFVRSGCGQFVICPEWACLFFILGLGVACL